MDLSMKNCKFEAPRPQGGASRKGNYILIVPLDPAYKAGLAGHLPVNKEKNALLAVKNRGGLREGHAGVHFLLDTGF
jgi:hypothetical protein